MDDRVQRTVRVIGGRTKLELVVRRVPDARREGLHEARLADPGIAEQQHYATLPFGHLLPSVAEKSELLLAPHERRAGAHIRLARRGRRLRCVDRRQSMPDAFLADHPPRANRVIEAFEREEAQALIAESLPGESSRVVRITTVSGMAAASRRAARLGVCPSAVCSRVAPALTNSPTMTKPVAIPIRVLKGSLRVRRFATLRLSASAARTARSALSSCALG